MAILVGPTQNLSILPHQKWRKIKMAAIWPNFEVRDRKLVYNPKLHMQLGVYRVLLLGTNYHYIFNDCPLFSQIFDSCKNLIKLFWGNKMSSSHQSGSKVMFTIDLCSPEDIEYVYVHYCCSLQHMHSVLQLSRLTGSHCSTVLAAQMNLSYFFHSTAMPFIAGLGFV